MIITSIKGAGVYRSEAFHKGNTYLTPKRKVKLYEFEFFKEDYEYGFLNGQQIDYKKNTVLIAKPGDIRQSKKHFSCYYIHIDMRDGAICDMINALPSVVTVDDESKYTQIFQNICSDFPPVNNTKKLSVIGWLLILISELSNDSHSLHQVTQITSKAQRNAILSAKTYINFNYRNDIKLKDIADSVHMSPNYFHKLFTSACQISPLQYLTKIRIEKAKTELMCSENTITQISESCGFNSYSYFCTVFKHYCGITPTEFRKSGNKYYHV
ncbi:MAG: helix-turn-helix transcriptional regulator [Clostridia bacterium]|nr:helix-turn-helix transcriptional regulator [Clostridia bacterium]